MAEHAALLADYQRLRQALRALSTTLMARLPQGALAECGQRLGLVREGPDRTRPLFVFDDGYEMPVLMDCCIYHSRDGGRTVIECFLAESPPPPGSDELTLLQAMLQVRYSLFLFEGAVPGVGIHLRDLLRGDSIFLVDLALSRTASAGLVLAGNIVSPAGLSMTTGAMLPVDAQILEDLVKQLQKRFGATMLARFRRLPSAEQSELAMLVTRACLTRGAASSVRAEDVTAEPKRPAPILPWRPAKRPPPNSPCPCGSGKKYKRCCGRA